MSEESRRKRLEILEHFKDDPERCSKAIAAYDKIRMLESDLWNLQSELRNLMAESGDPKNNRNYLTKAQSAATILRVAVEESMPHLLMTLSGNQITKKDEASLNALICELLMFGLHLMDRISYSKLGVEERAEFMDALLIAIHSELQPPIHSQLEHLYNSRNVFYSGFRKLYPEKNENLKGTLFWEFGKSVGTIYGNSNPVAITEASMFGMTFMQSIIQGMDAANVLP